jgi:drug/metabolite transporter (DMT)-like permease
MIPTNNSLSSQKKYSLWILFAVLSHVSWGIYPVFIRYLQTVSGFPSLTILALGNLLTLLVLSPRLVQLKMDLKSPVLWKIALIIALPSFASVVAARYTKAIYIQTVNLLIPFFVAILSFWMLKDKIHKYFIPCFLLSSIGAVLVIIKDPINFISQIDFSIKDVIGISLTVIGCLFLALYMVLLRSPESKKINMEQITIVQSLVQFVSSLVISIALRENWQTWINASWSDYLIFLLYALGIQLGGNFAQISSIQVLGATFVSNLLPTRLIVSLLMAYIFLGEHLSSKLQIVGVLIILITVTIYLQLSNKHLQDPNSK